MSETSWTDRIVGARMTVDQEFSARIQASEFTSQQWSLIMTATEFEIDQPTDPEAARIVANTDKVDQILPELDNMPGQMGAMGQPAGSSSGSSGGGVLSSIKGVLGLGGSDDGSEHDAYREAAETLTQEYAEQLQSHLESNGQWDSVRHHAAESNE